MYMYMYNVYLSFASLKWLTLSCMGWHIGEGSCDEGETFTNVCNQTQSCARNITGSAPYVLLLTLISSTESDTWNLPVVFSVTMC